MFWPRDQRLRNAFAIAMTGAFLYGLVWAVGHITGPYRATIERSIGPLP